MSVVPVALVQVACDGCGRTCKAMATDATTARIEASRDYGWQYRQFGSRRETPREWDACPACPLPATPAEARAIREARKP